MMRIQGRSLMKRNIALRWPLFMLATASLGGCIDRDVAMLNLRTGETMTCAGTPGGINPWSQTMACVADHEAQGWTRKE
jgi:hypothetical protein